MSEKTKIQWCDSTVNPIMGCVGCELFPPRKEVLKVIDAALVAAGVQAAHRRAPREAAEARGASPAMPRV